MSTDVGAFLPSYQHVTIFHLKELVGNQRTLIKCSEVQHVTLPFFEGLFFEDLYKFAQEYNGGIIMRALPSVEKEIKKLPREYLGNVIQTIAKEDFTAWVKQRVEVRNCKLADDRDLAIHMDQSIADIFNASNAVSGRILSFIFSLFLILLLFLLSWSRYQFTPDEGFSQA